MSDCTNRKGNNIGQKKKHPNGLDHEHVLHTDSNDSLELDFNPDWTPNHKSVSGKHKAHTGTYVNWFDLERT